MLLIDWRNERRNHSIEAKSFMDVTYWDDTEQNNGFIRDLRSPKRESYFSLRIITHPN